MKNVICIFLIIIFVPIIAFPQSCNSDSLKQWVMPENYTSLSFDKKDIPGFIKKALKEEHEISLDLRNPHTGRRNGKNELAFTLSRDDFWIIGYSVSGWASYSEFLFIQLEGVTIADLCKIRFLADNMNVYQLKDMVHKGAYVLTGKEFKLYSE